jgi:hypothetical protein
MPGDDLDDDDDLERAEDAARERELYLCRVEELNRQLSGWRGGHVIAASYAHEPTSSPFTTTAVNSVLVLQLSGPGGEGQAQLRCIACWRVAFLALWVNSHIEAGYREEGLARLIISDGSRLHVECLDAEIVASEPGAPASTAT